MALPKTTLFVQLMIVFGYTSNAQLFPAGTKLHVARLASFHEINSQNYLTTGVSNLTQGNRLYTLIDYPDWRASHHLLRLDSNKLYMAASTNDALLFDFNAQTNDSLSIYQHVFGIRPPYSDGSIMVGTARIRIDSISYEYYHNEQNERDSLREFHYSGIVKIPFPPSTDTLSYRYQFSIIEKIVTVYTTGSMRAYLSINVGARTLSDDHERLRCIEFPDGKSMKMDWWYQMVGNNYPCDYRFDVGYSELPEIRRVQCYPNPAHSQLFVKNYKGQLNIYDQLGKQVLQTYIDTDSPLDIHDLNDGMYHITLEKCPPVTLAVIH